MPLAVIIGLQLLLMVNFTLAPAVHVSPLISFTAVFYWTIFRPNVLPKWLVFVFGLTEDALYGLPLGYHTLVLMIFYGMVSNQRKHLAQQPFFVLWFLFGVSILFASLLLWITLSLYMTHILSIEPVVIQWAVTFAVYPLLYMLFNMVYVITE